MLLSARPLPYNDRDLSVLVWQCTTSWIQSCGQRVHFNIIAVIGLISGGNLSTVPIVQLQTCNRTHTVKEAITSEMSS
jgi:hypothetical protein